PVSSSYRISGSRPSLLFRTRRSSDRVVWPHFLAAAGSHEPRAEAQCAFKTSCPCHGCHCVPPQLILTARRCLARRRAARLAQYRDRKSTRLNSSHVKISYAVFCLKKE